MTDERKGLSKASLRGLRINERMAKMRENAPPAVSVVAANDDVRKLMRHPKGGGFPAEGGAMWPNDRFTKRRIADGSITVEKPKEKPKPDDPQQRSTNEPTDAAR
jgi:hypothetical protein